MITPVTVVIDEKAVNQELSHGSDADVSDKIEDTEGDTTDSENKYSDYLPSASSAQYTSEEDNNYICKPEKRYDFLVSVNEEDIIKLEESDSHWILPSKFDFSLEFINRRNVIIEECRGSDKNLQIDEELALNGIVLLDENITSNIVEEDNYYEACKETKNYYSKYLATDDEQFSSELMSFAKVKLITVDLLKY